MIKPLVAIVGRPNVGKSTFFNRVVGKRVSIVEDTPGVTRDRIYADAEWLNYHFTLVDTGGIDLASEDVLLSQMRAQAQIAIDTADVILFMVDAKQGLTAADEEVADFLRRFKKRVILIVNKVDNYPKLDNYYDFFALGLGDPWAVSAGQALGLGDVLDEIVSHFPEESRGDEEEDILHIAVVGKPNVGKSSLVNTILREERVIVSDIPGTTRDAIDTPFQEGEDRYTIIDTAGLRKRGRIEDESIERYSVIRTLTAIRRCDVALVLVDAQQGVTEQDTKIAGYVHEEGKSSIIIVNKWDLIEKQTNTMEKMRKQVLSDLSFMDYSPVHFISAKTGQRTQKILDMVKANYAEATKRIPTGLLNDALGDATAAIQPPSDKGRRLRIYYMTQVGVKPPHFVLFVNDPELMHFSYLRYLENYLRKTFGFSGTPIKFSLRARGEKGGRMK